MQGDVYSFGILLLELFTGKSPTDDVFINDLNLHQLASNALPNKAMKIADPSLFSEAGGDHYDKLDGWLASILKIGVTCSTESPGDRMDIRDAVKEMYKIKDQICSIKN